jgi:uncharacterized RDD family membrane protein YckC
MKPGADAAQPAGLARRSLALVYEALLLVAVILIGAAPFVMLTHRLDHDIERPLLQFYLVTLAGIYFTWQWRHGRTLAMRTWRLQLVTRDGAPLAWKHAWTRYFTALPGALLLGLGFLWALVDRDRQFLHDRVAGTMVINEEVAAQPAPSDF